MSTRKIATTVLLTCVLALTGGSVAHATDLAPTGSTTGSTSGSNRSCNADDASLLQGVADRLTTLANLEEQCDDKSTTSSQIFGELTS